MRKVAASMLLGVLVSSNAFGGIVTFDPGEGGKPRVQPGDTAQFEVFVSRDSNYDFANVVVASDDLEIISLDYAQSWLDSLSFAPPVPVATGIFPSDLFFGGFLSSATTGSALVGTLTVGTNGLDLGEYEVFVDSSRDFGTSGIGILSDTEGLSGSALVNVVPEPMTLSLLGLGALALLRRRRTA